MPTQPTVSYNTVNLFFELLSTGTAHTWMMRSTTPGSTNVPFLPPELYSCIARHIPVPDLPHFCLASKTLAQAGRPELFHTIVLRATLASWTAFQRIREHEQLNRLVRTLIHDTTSWRIGSDVRDWHEWTRYCLNQANHYALVHISPTRVALYRELAESRHLWEAYLSRLAEEAAVDKEINVGNIDLPNLRKYHVIRGAYQLKEHRVARFYEPENLPIAAALCDWRGDSFSQAPRGRMFAPLHYLPSAAPNIIKWRLDGLHAAVLGPFPKLHTTNPDVISLKIRFVDPGHGRNCYKVRLLRHLDQWTGLESLTLDLGNRIPGTITVLQTIQDVFGVGGGPADATSALNSPVKFQKLRKLSLGHFYSSPEALMSLVMRHGSTLRDLRLHAIRLRHEDEEISTQVSWQEVFQSIGTSSKLHKLMLSGLFCNDIIEDDNWDFDSGELGDDVANSILRGEQPSQREEPLSSRRSNYGSHDQYSGNPHVIDQNGAVTPGEP